MATFSFRNPGSAARRSRSRAGGGDGDWAETRPSLSGPGGADGTDALLPVSAFDQEPQDAPGTQAPAPAAPPPPTAAPDPAAAPWRSGRSGPAAAPRRPSPAEPDPGFAKDLTARAADDNLLGAGWYISSWDLMRGCDVIEGTPIDLLPPEWRRKRPRS